MFSKTGSDIRLQLKTTFQKNGSAEEVNKKDKIEIEINKAFYIVCRIKKLGAPNRVEKILLGDGYAHFDLFLHGVTSIIEVNLKDEIN